MSRDTSVSALPLFVPLLLLTFFYVFVPTATDQSELSHVALARAITDHGTFRLNDVLPGLPVPITTVSVEGDSYSVEAPGLAWLSVPFVLMTKVSAWVRGAEVRYAGLLWWLRLVLVQLPSVVFGFWLFFALDRRSLPQRAARFAALTLTCTWPLLLSVQTLAAEGLAAMWWVSAMIILSETDDWPGPQRFFWAGCVVAMATTVSYLTWWLLLPTALFVISRARQPRWSLTFFVPVAVGIGLVLGYHSLCFGHALEWPGSSALTAWSWSRATALWSDHTYGLLWVAPVWALALFGLAVMATRGEAAVALVCAFAVVWLSGCVPRDLLATSPFVSIRSAMPIAVFLAWPLARAAETLSGVLFGGVVLGTLAAYSLAVTAFAAPYAQFFTSDVVNPLRDVAWFVWRDGVVPSGLGHMLGFSGERALWPFFVLLTGVGAILAAAGDEEGATWRRNLGVMALGILGLWFRLSADSQKAPDPKIYEAAIAVERQLGGDNRFSLRAAAVKGGDRALAEGQSATALGQQQRAIDAYREFLRQR